MFSYSRPQKNTILLKPNLHIIKDDKGEKKTLILYTLSFSCFHKVDLKRILFC
jgi:hypothetical protein